jgi:hypothetical protein
LTDFQGQLVEGNRADLYPEIIKTRQMTPVAKS